MVHVVGSFPNLDLSHSAAMLSLRRIKTFVFARQASPILEFNAMLNHVKTKLFILLRLNMAAKLERSS